MRVDERTFSRLISPYDVRDYRYAAFMVSEASFPKTYKLSEVSVKNQGSTGSCVAHACSSIVEYHNKRQQNNETVFSTEFIYGYRPDGYYVGEGMYLRDALKTLQKVGDCPLANLRGNNKCEKAMENVDENFDSLKDLAYPHRISSYIKLTTDDEIKMALMDSGYVLVSMPWHADYKLKDGVYTYTSDENRGYHAVTIYGWNEQGWLVHNSWGKNWGQDGKFIVPFGFKWTEAWAITDTIVNNDDIVKPEEKWYIKLFSSIINKIVNFVRKFIKKT